MGIGENRRFRAFAGECPAKWIAAGDLPYDTEGRGAPICETLMTIHSRFLLPFLASLVIPATSSAQSEPDYTGRVPTGLQVLYDFRADKGNVITDRSRAGTPINLTISDPKAVLRTNGALEVRGKTSIGTVSYTHLRAHETPM